MPSGRQWLGIGWAPGRGWGIPPPPSFQCIPGLGVASLRSASPHVSQAGAFNILDRLQWHYGVFACNMPEKSDLQLIYGQILGGHLSQFSREVQSFREPLTHATIELHGAVTKQFLPTAIKFHYQWNLREMSNIIQVRLPHTHVRHPQ